MKFSFYRKPIFNTTPYQDITLIDLYNVLKGTYYKAVTETLRKLPENKYKKQKERVLDYITPGGTFSYREKESIKTISGLISIDIDHIDNPEEVKDQLTTYEGVQLIYTSPSGKGVKAIWKDSGKCDSYLEEFENIADQLKQFEIKVDKTTSDISRACFLCYDPLVWISPEILGQLIQDGQRNGEIKTSPTAKEEDNKSITSLGISHKQSSTFQQIAENEYFETLKDGRTILMNPAGYPASWDIIKEQLNTAL